MNQLRIPKPDFNESGKTEQGFIQQPTYDRYEDEISLVELWLVLVNHKKVFLIVFAVLSALGLMYALAMQKSWQFTTSIEIGTRLQKEVITSIEDPQTVLAKIQESYIPLVLNEYRSANPDTSGYKITARIPKGSQLIVLETKGVEADAATHLLLQGNVVEKIRQDHQRILGIIRKEVEIDRNSAINKHGELKDQALLIQAQEKHAGDLEAFLKQQLQDEKSHLEKAESNRKRAVKEATNEARAMTLLMLDSNIDNQRDRIFTLQERLRVEIVNSKDTFIKQLADNKREQLSQLDQVSRLESHLANLRETRALVPPMQSSEPVGISRSLVVLLALFLGLMLGVFAAFFAGFLNKVKEQMPQKS